MCQKLQKNSILMLDMSLQYVFDCFRYRMEKGGAYNMLWQKPIDHSNSKMCYLKSFYDISNNRTILFMIVLLSLKLCTPQDLTEEFNDNLDSELGVVMPVKRVKASRDADGPCRLSELHCDTGQCISLDKYCNGEDDCGDKSDEPKSCTRKLNNYFSM